MIKHVTLVLLALVMFGGIALADTPVTTVIRDRFSAAQVSVTTAATLIKAANYTRASLTICNHDATAHVYIGGSTVATSTGFRIQANTCFTIDRTTAAVYGISTGTVTVSYWEE